MKTNDIFYLILFLPQLATVVLRQPPPTSQCRLECVSWGVPLHFDQFFSKLYILINHFRSNLARGVIMVPDFSCDDITSSLARSACRVFFSRQSWDISSEKVKINYAYYQLTGELNFHTYFVTLNDLDHVTSKIFLWSRVTTGRPLIFYFHTQNTSLIIACQREK